MKIAGLQKVSLQDYPGKISCIVFTQGCNFRCGYCYNPQSVIPERFEEPLPEEEFFEFLGSRVGKIDAVVLCGGEPTVQGDLITFIEKIKEMGFLVKLDTNGSNPQVLLDCLWAGVDYVAMDVKAPPHKYKMVTGSEDVSSVLKSIEIVLFSGVEHEFRTTVCADQVDVQDLVQIGTMVKGCSTFALQKFKDMGGVLIDPSLKGTLPDAELEGVKAYLEGKGICKNVIIR